MFLPLSIPRSVKSGPQSPQPFLSPQRSLNYCDPLLLDGRTRRVCWRARRSPASYTLSPPRRSPTMLTHMLSKRAHPHVIVSIGAHGFLRQIAHASRLRPVYSHPFRVDKLLAGLERTTHVFAKRHFSPIFQTKLGIRSKAPIYMSFPPTCPVLLARSMVLRFVSAPVL
ncbi:hypothetical protein CPB84DRAFT_332427 [Gymnopilus junonius]|uniref:Uncharacterized protein n=1 Tax=Gymnopilus junonius TaxID=109634 RepID=A0A9P5NE54_GYMJU|nr:hypothetical protein CPB84DRAFT_332427 [Gymnopilus junonius]